MSITQQSRIVETSHTSRGFPEHEGNNAAYHYLISPEGEVKKFHDEDIPLGHTRNREVNLNSIAIVLEGNFNIEKPKAKQLISLGNLMNNIKSRRNIKEIIPHSAASPTSGPGKNLMPIFQ